MEQYHASWLYPKMPICFQFLYIYIQLEWYLQDQEKRTVTLLEQTNNTFTQLEQTSINNGQNLNKSILQQTKLLTQELAANRANYEESMKKLEKQIEEINKMKDRIFKEHKINKNNLHALFIDGMDVIYRLFKKIYKLRIGNKNLDSLLLKAMDPEKLIENRKLIKTWTKLKIPQTCHPLGQKILNKNVKIIEIISNIMVHQVTQTVNEESIDIYYSDIQQTITNTKNNYQQYNIGIMNTQQSNMNKWMPKEFIEDSKVSQTQTPG